MLSSQKRGRIISGDEASELSVELPELSVSKKGRGLFESHYDPLKELTEMDEDQTATIDDKENTSSIIEIKKREPPCIQKECHDILTSPKWWANWFAFLLAILAAIVSSLYIDNQHRDWRGNPIDYFVFIPWKTNPNDSLKFNGAASNAFGMFIIFVAMLVCVTIHEIVTNFHDPKKTKNCNDLFKKILHHFLGIFIFTLITLFSFFMDAQIDLNSSGIGYSIVSIIFGMVMTNVFLYIYRNNPENDIWEKAIKISAKECEFYIKVGLVLLATDFDLIITLGPAGLLVSWLIPPIVLVFMWFFGVRLLKITNFDFVITISAGAAICGTSAIAAVAPTVGLGEEDVAIAMAMLTFFTMLYMIAVPYICILGDIDMEVCGAWIGGSVDETGKVVASVSILDDEQATDTAVLIKVSQNILIAFVCLSLAVLYDDMVDLEDKRIEKRMALLHDTSNGNDYGGRDNDTTNDTVEKYKKMKRIKAQKGNKCAFLWKKFPKFILGYLVLSIIISFIIIPIDKEYSDRFVNNIKQMSNWLFTLGFVGIGAKTKLTTLWEAIKDGKYLKLYLVGQTFDTIITFIAAFIVFTYII